MVDPVPFPSLVAPLVNKEGRCIPPWNSFFQNLFNLVNTGLLGPELQGIVDSGIGIPLSNDCGTRVASAGTAHDFGITYVNNHTNNGLWCFDPFLQIWRFGRINPATAAQIAINNLNCTIDGVLNQATIPLTHYNIFVYFANSGDRYLTAELSTQPAIYANTLLNDHGILVKGPPVGFDISKRFVGYIIPDATNILWAAGGFGVFQDHISSYYNRQQLESQIVLTGSVAPPTNVWQFPSTEFISSTIWDDGNDFTGGCFGAVKTTNAPDIVYVGITRNQALPPPPGSVQPVYCAVANQPYPFCIDIPGGSVATQVYRLDLVLRSASGAGTISIHNDAVCDGAGMTMNYTH